ncbi:hypothetical protein R5R35_013663 [Gryllus longicercus]|uniref:Connector enhancer of kinase suppressor of ras 2 n=1 Tax=Gryllus longicercus TaxID=2509291 RepID=A0AAN9Z9Y8_9ORTH
MAYVNVAEWKPEQVTEWLKGLDNSILAYVHSFLNNEVNGQQLLNIRPDDLDHLGVQKLGHQEIILEAVEHLRNFHYELDRENLQLLALRLSCRARSLYKELLYQEDSEPVSTQTLADVASIITTVKPIACWLGRSPFAGQFDYHHRKMELLNLSIEIATCAQRDRFAERPVEEIRRSCDQLASLADSIIRDIQDPLLLQPASLDLATVKKRAGDDLGFFIQPSFHGVHQISELKFSSPAQQCGKIEEGDEVVQVNYQTVVGWQSKKVMFLLEESPTDVFLTLKKRPRHTKVYGQIYIKPYRLPSKKRATPYTRWHENLPSPRPELLTIPDFEIPLPRSSPKQGITTPEVVPLSDSEPLASSSSSGDDDEDDGAFLPGVADLSQASPTSMRLYLPKQRSSVQRRATVTGASPTSRRPPVNIEQFWRELQLQYQWRGTGQNSSSTTNSDLCQLRDKPHGISSSLVSVSDVMRPTTCLGIEQSMKHSLNVIKQKHQKDKNFTGSTLDEKKKEVNKASNIYSYRDPMYPEGNKFSGLKTEKLEKSIEKDYSTAHNIACGNRSDSGEYSMKDISENSYSESPKDFSCSDSMSISTSKDDFRTYSPGCNSLSTISSLISYPHEMAKDKTNDNMSAEECSENVLESNIVDSVSREIRLDKIQQYPIDENTLKIPYGNMKYIDDTSDTNLSKEFSDDCEIQSPLDDAEMCIRTLPNLPKCKEKFISCKVSDGSVTLPGNFSQKHAGLLCNEIRKQKQSESVGVNTSPVSNIDEFSSQISVLEDKKSNELSAVEQSVNNTACQTSRSNSLDWNQKSTPVKHVMSSRNKIEVAKKLTINTGSGSAESNISSGNSSFSYRNKLAQSLGQLGSVRSAPSTVCSPKTLKRRNMLLAKRRNVNLKDLGQADCEGWLLHRCRWSGTGASLGTTWTRAWFVLKGSIFYGFKSPHASKANIMISLPGFTASVADEVKSKKYAFKVYHTGTVFYFAAESEQLLSLWLECIALGTVIQDTGKSLCSEDAFFSETDDDSDHEMEKESGTCFPNPRTYKFSNFLGGNSSPVASRSQQNLASETKLGHEVQKKFGSLKKLGRKVTDGSGNQNSGHNDGGNSSSLDRKYLCFLGSSRNSTVPVPTAHFRSYRRVPNSAPNKTLHDSSQKIIDPVVKGVASGNSSSPRYSDSAKDLPKKTRGLSNIRSMDSTETPKLTLEKVRSTNYNNLVLTPNSNLCKSKEKESHPVPNKPPVSDRFLRPVKIGDLRDRSTHASNPTLQLSGDLSDYRLAAERLREFNVQRNRPREDTSGFVTLEEFMLSRQEEERKSEALRNKISNERTEVYQSVESSYKSNEVARHSSFNCINTYKSSGETKETCDWDSSCASECSGDVATPGRSIDTRWTANQLKSVAQYQPPPVAQSDDSQPLTMAFEMHLGERESSSKTSKFRSIFTSKSNRHHNQKPNNLEVPLSGGPDSRQKTLLGSPRLHRAIFRSDKYHGGTKGSTSDSNSNSSSVSSPITPSLMSPSEWAVDCASETGLSQTKPTMGISMLGKRPTRRTPLLSSQTPPPPVTVSAPDYPGLEYPPVFEPETYTLADASSLRSRPRVQSEKPV